jgi:hypothetical protein
MYYLKGKRESCNINGVFWKIKQRFCGTYKKCSTFPPFLVTTGGFLCAIKFAKFPHFRLMSNEFKRNWKMVFSPK